MPNRETLIALRARHTAHRVASELLHPELEKLPEPVILIDEPPRTWGGSVVPVDEILARANANPPRRWLVDEVEPRIVRAVEIIAWIAFWLLLFAIAWAMVYG